MLSLISQPRHSLLTLCNGVRAEARRFQHVTQSTCAEICGGSVQQTEEADRRTVQIEVFEFLVRELPRGAGFQHRGQGHSICGRTFRACVGPHRRLCDSGFVQRFLNYGVMLLRRFAFVFPLRMMNDSLYEGHPRAHHPKHTCGPVDLEQGDDCKRSAQENEQTQPGPSCFVLLEPGEILFAFVGQACKMRVAGLPHTHFLA